MDDTPGHKAWLEPTVLQRLLRPFSKLLADVPLPSAQRLKCFALRGDDARLPLSTFLSWLNEAAEELHDPGLGLRALAHLERGVGDVVELGAGSAESLGDALVFLSQRVRILNEAADFQLWIDEPVASFELRSRVRLPRAMRDFQLGAVLLAMQGWLGATASDLQVWLGYPEPRCSKLHRSMFGDSLLRFDAPCDAVVFPSFRLRQRPLAADAALHAVLSRHAEQLSARGRLDEPELVPRVREALFELLPTGGGDARAVAQRFGMSPRTLTRHLAREGASFRELLDEVRHQRALRYLETTNMRLQRVAQLLGYAETASFCRAFVRWRGQTANRYRRSCQDQARPASAQLEAPN